jgi:NADH:ubiquinone reductase (H+-translocating)
MADPPHNQRHRVVVVGGGFGGLHATQRLRRLPVDVTLVDRRNFHLFQPLTYQVATGALSPGDIAYPLRALFKDAENVTVVLGNVKDVDLDAHVVQLEDGPDLPYDTLMVSAGSSYSYFGHEEWREHAAEVKSLESATSVRSQLLAAFERAELLPPGPERDAELTFVVVGGGPTGVEMAGQIGELATDTLRRDFRHIDPTKARVLLVEAADRVLGTFPESLSNKAVKALEHLGAAVVVNRTVVGIDPDGVDLEAPDGTTERLPTRTVVWAAGVTASGLASELAERTGAETDRAGRALVQPDLSLPGHPEVLLVGDMVQVKGGGPLPGVAPVAIQQGRYVAKVVGERLAGRDPGPFRYHDKGNVATIGRGKAVADLGWLRLSGFPAWLLWAGIHLFYLIGFRNRLLVLIQWMISYLSRSRGARLITGSGKDPAPGTRPPGHRDEALAGDRST